MHSMRTRPFPDQSSMPQGPGHGTGAETMPRPRVGDEFVFMPSREGGEGRIGIYSRGGCHLHALFGCAPLVRPVAGRTACIYHHGLVAHGRSDLELQTLQTLPSEWTEPAIQKLHLSQDYFQPKLFEKTFTVPGHEDLGEFPKTVVTISIGSDAGGRRLYRHKQHGFLVDPGGGWLKSLDATLNDLSAVAWFRQNIESVGLISVEAFMENFTKIIQLLRANTTTHVIVFNALTIEPGNTAHNFQFVKHSDTMRWRRFNIALMELSRQLDFPIVDLDRIVRRYGIKDQRSAAHFPPQVDLVLARQTFRIMNDLGVFSA